MAFRFSAVQSEAVRRMQNNGLDHDADSLPSAPQVSPIIIRSDNAEN